MPTYEYQHVETPCELGEIFEWKQSMQDAPLENCPRCFTPVRKLISRTTYQKKHSNTQIRDAGFSKLVKRDDGVYENVTQRPGESKIVRRDDPASMASLKPRLGD